MLAVFVVSAVVTAVLVVSIETTGVETVVLVSCGFTMNTTCESAGVTVTIAGAGTPVSTLGVGTDGVVSAGRTGGDTVTVVFPAVEGVLVASVETTGVVTSVETPGVVNV